MLFVGQDEIVFELSIMFNASPVQKNSFCDGLLKMAVGKSKTVT